MDLAAGLYQWPWKTPILLTLLPYACTVSSGVATMYNLFSPSLPPSLPPSLSLSLHIETSPEYYLMRKPSNDPCCPHRLCACDPELSEVLCCCCEFSRKPGNGYENMGLLYALFVYLFSDQCMHAQNIYRTHLLLGGCA